MADLSFHFWELDDRDITFVDTLPVTTMERTVDSDLLIPRSFPLSLIRWVKALISTDMS
ncbi:MAG: hypothetical protein Q4A07_08870 [Coriobacteriales bacterium]|nr:hypothetical protein [Coriobacteriales bacterium]